MAIKRTAVIFPPAPLWKKILAFLGKPFFWLAFIFIIAGSGLGVIIHRISHSKKFLIFLLFIFSLSFLIFNFYFLILKDLPSPNQLRSRQPILSTKIYDRNGRLLYKIYRRENRTLVELKEIPPYLIQAALAVEDAEFYSHHGFSPRGIFRAVLQDLKGGKLSGGSTITQQLVKNTLLTAERTWQRKLKEVVLAVLVETKFSKDEILKMYLNEVGFGGAAYGVEEAAQLYFGKSATNLDLAESALLAGLPVSPTTFSPFGAHPEKAKERQKQVLERMREEGFITAEEEKQALGEELHFALQRIDIKAPHFVMFVKDLLVQKYGERLVEEGGLEVTTTLDLDLQNFAQQTVFESLKSLNSPKSLKVSNGAALVTSPKTGEILAMVGSKDYFSPNDGNVNLTLRPRQPGSAIKPVNYSLALENGFTAATILSDTPVTYKIAGQPPYSPNNYDSRFHGNVPLRTALASSYNVPAVKILASLGVQRMIEQGQKLGITTWEDPSRFGLSLTLGGGEVKMTDLAVVYGTLANLGIRQDLTPILKVADYSGKMMEQFPQSPQSPQSPQIPQVLSPQTAYLLSDILSDNAARTPAFGSRSQLVIPGHPSVAVKTGTTQNLRDNWAIGYTPDFLAAAWVGNNDNSPMSYVASGVTGASPIWNKIMSFLLKDLPDQEFPRPEDLGQIIICAATATLPCDGCPSLRKEWFAAGTEPKTHCNPESFKKPEDSKNKILEGVSTGAN